MGEPHRNPRDPSRRGYRQRLSMIISETALPTPSLDDVKRLIEQGLVTSTGELTELGELKLHQLKLLEWMSKSPRYRAQ